MNTGELSLNFNEKVIFALRELYLGCGYSQYKMSKFEEYDLYARNKDFLISDSVITFTDTNGKLMALKPDVTLSIIKNIKDQPESIRKVYYNENVYRISKGSHCFKEIMQVGLECFGNIDDYSICEVITLACKSLKAISQNCILDISHLGLISGVLDSLNIPEYSRNDILKCIGDKNIHGLLKVCGELNISEENIEILKLLVSTAGKPDEVLPALENALSTKTDVSPLKQLCRIISAIDDDIKDMLRIDFSDLSDMKYYNGIVFKGFIENVPASVLSGGQYDKLMQKMKRSSSAIGFAVYLDTLERLSETKSAYDVDIILLYSSSDDIKLVNKNVNSLTKKGKSVLACKNIPENIKFKELINLNKGEVDILENNA